MISPTIGIVEELSSFDMETSVESLKYGRREKGWAVCTKISHGGLPKTEGPKNINDLQNVKYNVYIAYIQCVQCIQCMQQV